MAQVGQRGVVSRRRVAGHRFRARPMASAGYRGASRRGGASRRCCCHCRTRKLHRPSNYHRGSALSYLEAPSCSALLSPRRGREEAHGWYRARSRKPAARESADVCGGERCGPHELATDVAEQPFGSRATRDHRVVVLPASSASAQSARRLGLYYSGWHWRTDTGDDARGTTRFSTRRRVHEDGSILSIRVSNLFSPASHQQSWAETANFRSRS